jgi:hypothetical protein
MKLIVRRVLIGLVCGAVSSLFLCLAAGNLDLGLPLGALLGVAQIFAFFDLRGGSALDRANDLCRAGIALLGDNQRHLSPIGRRTTATMDSRQNAEVVILGGGFAGVTTAEHLEKQFRGYPTVSFTLISETNSWLFTPMLVEVATSGLDPTHVTTPLRTGLKRTRVLRGRVASIDLERGQVHLNDGPQTALRTLELFFPRDIVQTIDFNDSGMRRRDPKVVVT